VRRSGVPKADADALVALASPASLAIQAEYSGPPLHEVRAAEDAHVEVDADHVVHSKQTLGSSRALFLRGHVGQPHYRTASALAQQRVSKGGLRSCRDQSGRAREGRRRHRSAPTRTTHIPSSEVRVIVQTATSSTLRVAGRAAHASAV
jgi:hypothetical protein